MSAAPLKNIREGQLIEAEIRRLGAQGDGIAQAGTRQLYVPLALPGEKVMVKIIRPLGDSYTAELTEVLTPSAERVPAPCPHFAQCGGCSLQHLAAQPYKAHKRHIVVEALRQHKLTDIEVRDALVMPAQTRRRLTLAAMHTKNGPIIGFNARASHVVVDVQSCSIARPELVALLPRLRSALAPWLVKAKTLDVALTSTTNGIDCLLTGPEPDLEARESLAALGKEPALARISWRKNERSEAEPMLMLREPVVKFADTSVAFPAGSFLQASLEGEAVLTQLVTGALREVTGKIADLFAGLGTFSLPLAKQASVLAVENDKACMSALAATGKVETSRRDLFRDPLNATELNEFEAVVFDPPRAGAEAQVTELAQSDVPLVVAVSCNPGTFARDAATLVNGGYTCAWVQPVDQFLWSGHVELVALFTRKEKS